MLWSVHQSAMVLCWWTGLAVELE